MYDLNAKGQKQFNTGIVCCVISCVAVGARLLCKRYQKAGFHSDDYSIIGGLVFYLVSVSCVSWGSINGGGGLEMKEMMMLIRKNPENLKLVENYLEGIFLGYTFYIPAMFGIKLSILFFYRRIFFVKAKYLQVSMVVILVSTAWFIAAETANILTCQPVDAFWHRTKPGKCFNFNVMFLGLVVAEIVIDTAIYILPFRVAFQLQLPIRTKVAVAGIFALGGFSIMTNIIRLTYIYQPNSAYVDFAEAEFWSNIHTVTAIISACLPLCKSFWNSVSQATDLFFTSLRSLIRTGSRNSSNSELGGSKPRNLPDGGNQDFGSQQGSQWLFRKDSSTTINVTEQLGEVEIELPPFLSDCTPSHKADIV